MSTISKSSSSEELLPTHLKKESSAFTGIMSCTVYSLCSISMVLVNKYISSSLSEEVKQKLPQLSVVLYQCIIAVVLVEFARFMKWVDYPQFSFKTARQWLPVNLLFIGMLCSSFIALIYISVPMFTVFKNLSNIITVTGDWYLFKEPVSWLTVVAIAIMTLGAVMAGANDLEFNLVGYLWIAVNCVLTAAYVLYMRYASVNINLPRFGMVYYNNLLSACILFPICVLKGEFAALRDPAIMTPTFLISNSVAGFVGFYLNFASLWCVGSTSATTYAVVGSLNKVPITVLGFVMFHAKMTSEGILFVVLATLGGFLYAYTKLPKGN